MWCIYHTKNNRISNSSDICSFLCFTSIFVILTMCFEAHVGFGLTTLTVSIAVELMALDKTLSWTCSALKTFSHKSTQHYLLC